MDRAPVPRSVRRAPRAVAAACLLFAACGEPEWKLPTSDAELDAAARRGDSMAMQIAAGRAIADTLARIAAGELDPSLITTLGGSADAPLPAAVPVPSADPSVGGTGAAMTARAIARADSLIREDAQRALAASQRRAADRVGGSGRASGAVGAVGAARRTESDTLRGILALEGTPPAVRVTLVSTEASMPVGLSGMPVSDLMRLNGMETVVRGVRVSPRDLAVTSFTVRAIDGIPVVDGVLVNDGGAWSVRMADGSRRALPQVPTPLQAFVGARVWVALASGASPSYGVITRR